jgi:hypothetical protein
MVVPGHHCPTCSGRFEIGNSADAEPDGPSPKQALEEFARNEKVLASELALLAAELERQGQPGIAAMLQQASRRYGISSAQNRTLAMALDRGIRPSGNQHSCSALPKRSS